MRSSFHIGPAVILGLVFAVACRDGTAPGPGPRQNVSFDAVHAIEKVAPLTAVFDQQIITSFDAALPFFGRYLRPSATLSLSVQRRADGFDARVTRTLAPLTSIRSSAIPADALGKTFVYDLGTDAYVVDPTASDAPSSGVRYVLYAWEAGSETPVTPLTRVGFVDVVPSTATGTSDDVRVTLVRDAPRLTITDFSVVHGKNSDGDDAFGIAGSATDGATTADVALTGTQSGTPGSAKLLFNTHLSSNTLGVGTFEQLTFDQAAGSQGGRLEVRYENHAFTDDAAPSGSARELRFDGDLYARVLFTHAADVTRVEYIKADGTSLTQKEITDVNALIDRVMVADFFWINLAFP